MIESVQKGMGAFAKPERKKGTHKMPMHLSVKIYALIIQAKTEIMNWYETIDYVIWNFLNLGL